MKGLNKGIVAIIFILVIINIPKTALARAGEGVEDDFVWIHIKAKAKDYVINEETGELIEGNKHKRLRFEEYWKFIRNDRRWILDEIRQIEDVENLDFFDINISK